MGSRRSGLTAPYSSFVGRSGAQPQKSINGTLGLIGSETHIDDYIAGHMQMII